MVVFSVFVSRAISGFSPPFVISFQVVIWVVAIGIPLAKNLGIMSLWIVPTSCFSVSKRLVLLDILHESGRADIMGRFFRIFGPRMIW